MNNLHEGSDGKTYFQGNHFLLKPAATDFLREEPACCPELNRLLKGEMEIARGQVPSRISGLAARESERGSRQLQ
jgi:hypothetical protein